MSPELVSRIALQCGPRFTSISFVSREEVWIVLIFSARARAAGARPAATSSAWRSALRARRRERTTVAGLGRPEIAALIGVVVLGLLGEEFGTQFVGEVVPAVGAQHGAIHFVVQLAQAPDRLAALARRRGSGCRSWSCPRWPRPSARRGGRDRSGPPPPGSDRSRCRAGRGRSRNSQTGRSADRPSASTRITAPTSRVRGLEHAKREESFG